ncbi:hypothetical protein K502DRAFT_329695 [Neoconidiobolus thromboides FSU 785]|nr:hypothetical protein K502DRAFT_329695 [Neoconidiobolus thromboides FSU 785]
MYLKLSNTLYYKIIYTYKKEDILKRYEESDHWQNIIKSKEVVVTNCGHMFHNQCIERYTKTVKKQSICPLCSEQIHFKTVILNNFINPNDNHEPRNSTNSTNKSSDTSIGQAPILLNDGSTGDKKLNPIQLANERVEKDSRKELYEQIYDLKVQLKKEREDFRMGLHSKEKRIDQLVLLVIQLEKELEEKRSYINELQSDGLLLNEELNLIMDKELQFKSLERELVSEKLSRDLLRTINYDQVLEIQLLNKKIQELELQKQNIWKLELQQEEAHEPGLSRQKQKIHELESQQKKHNDIILTSNKRNADKKATNKNYVINNKNLKNSQSKKVNSNEINETNCVSSKVVTRYVNEITLKIKNKEANAAAEKVIAKSNKKNDRKLRAKFNNRAFKKANRYIKHNYYKVIKSFKTNKTNWSTDQGEGCKNLLKRSHSIPEDRSKRVVNIVEPKAKEKIKLPLTEYILSKELKGLLHIEKGDFYSVLKRCSNKIEEMKNHNAFLESRPTVHKDSLPLLMDLLILDRYRLPDLLLTFHLKQ